MSYLFWVFGWITIMGIFYTGVWGTTRTNKKIADQFIEYTKNRNAFDVRLQKRLFLRLGVKRNEKQGEKKGDEPSKRKLDLIGVNLAWVIEKKVKRARDCFTHLLCSIYDIEEDKSRAILEKITRLYEKNKEGFFLEELIDLSFEEPSLRPLFCSMLKGNKKGNKPSFLKIFTFDLNEQEPPIYLCHCPRVVLEALFSPSDIEKILWVLKEYKTEGKPIFLPKTILEGHRYSSLFCLELKSKRREKQGCLFDNGTKAIEGFIY